MSDTLTETLQMEMKAGKALYVEIRTPEGSSYSGGASSVLLPGTKGSMGILPRHAPLLSSLEVGFVRVRDPLGTEWPFVTGLGFVEVHDNHVLVLVDFADSVAEIDVERAKEALQRAKARLRTPSEEVDVTRAEAAMHRAVTRLRYATMG